MKRLITPAIVGFLIFLVAYKPDTAATLGKNGVAFLGVLATGAADVLTSWLG
jgi:hypothetical protein